MFLSRPAFSLSLACHARPLLWLAALAWTAMPAWAQPMPSTERPLVLGERWSLALQADDDFQGTLALHLDPMLQAGATVALQQAQGMRFGPVPERVAMAWVGWKLQPGWMLSAGLRHASRRYADRAHVWSLRPIPTPTWRCTGRRAPAAASRCTASMATTGAPPGHLRAPPDNPMR